MSYCPNCGNKIEPGHNFCSNCGQKPSQEKVEKVQRTNTKKRNKWILPIAIVILIVAIGAIAGGVVIGLNSGGKNDYNPTYTYYPTPTYNPPTQTYQPTSTYQTHQVNLVEPNNTLASGHYSSQIATIQAGSTVTISWSADAYVEVWIITDTQYPSFTTLAYTSNYVGLKTGNSGTLTCPIANTDTYYLIISRPGNGLYSAATIYSATATW